MARRRHPIRNLFLVLVLIGVALGGCYLFYRISLQAVSQSDETVSFRIEEGQSASQTLDSLQQDGLIRSSFVASLYARLHGLQEQYAGYFVLSPDMSTPEILEYLSNPDNASDGTVIVTEPEGTWARDLAGLLHEQYPQYSADSFLELWNDEAYIRELAAKYEWLKPSQISADVFVKLEGYLFPETYFMEPDFDQRQITSMFLDQFDAVYGQIQNEVTRSGMSLEEVLTLASIVQFESGDPAQMKSIAGVFFNRLEQGMPLGSSVTVCYALYEDFDDFQDCEVNTDIDSPYNTYIHTGLPVGPILNPGLEAIEAVLEPEANDYLYFVSDIYGDGSIHYASTYEEHLANMEKYHLIIE